MPKLLISHPELHILLSHYVELREALEWEADTAGGTVEDAMELANVKNRIEKLQDVCKKPEGRKAAT